MNVLIFISIAIGLILLLFVCLYYYGRAIARKQVKQEYEQTIKEKPELKVVHKKKYKYSGSAYRDFKKKGK